MRTRFTNPCQTELNGLLGPASCRGGFHVAPARFEHVHNRLHPGPTVGHGLDDPNGRLTNLPCAARRLKNALDGSYIGGGTTCEGDTCEDIDARVACCLPSGMCDLLIPDECALQVGVSQEEESTCEMVVCPTGACCLPSGTCTILTEDACGQDKGSYVGDDTTCDATDCTNGACCLDDADLCITADTSGCSGEGRKVSWRWQDLRTRRLW